MIVIVIVMYLVYNNVVRMSEFHISEGPLRHCNWSMLVAVSLSWTALSPLSGHWHWSQLWSACLRCRCLPLLLPERTQRVLRLVATSTSRSILFSLNLKILSMMVSKMLSLRPQSLATMMSSSSWLPHKMHMSKSHGKQLYLWLSWHLSVLPQLTSELHANSTSLR